MAEATPWGTDLERAARILVQGGVVACPTESWYGLAVDPFQVQAVERLYVLKERPKVKPILLLIDTVDQLAPLITKVPEPYRPIMDRFWPGGVTLVFPAAPRLPSVVTAGTGTVAIRACAHPLTRQLIRRFGGPITGTSANRSGAPPQSTPAGVLASLDHGLDYVLDGGPTSGLLGSTIIGLRQGELVCLRDGLVPWDHIRTVLSSPGG